MSFNLLLLFLIMLVEIKVKVFLRIRKHHAAKAYGGSEIKASTHSTPQD